jgi:7-cyano-7-deazaguanine synthase
MCAIVGASIWALTEDNVPTVNRIINQIFDSSLERGRDGRGFQINQLNLEHRDGGFSMRSIERDEQWGRHFDFFTQDVHVGTMIGNLRAEPTTEYVKDKGASDQQPYTLGPWSIVHNGTIANDKVLRRKPGLETKIDSAAIVETLNAIESGGLSWHEVADLFTTAIGQLKGSYAILAIHEEHPDLIMAACNYRPIWFAKGFGAIFFASARQYFPAGLVPQMLTPYSAAAFLRGNMVPLGKKRPANDRALVVCSGGMDSVVAATWAKHAGYEITLLHFRYGSRAEGPEVSAMWKVCNALGVGMIIKYLDAYSPEDSPLLRADSTIAGGEEGAEFAHEWVPARNLLMLAHATAHAEAHGFGTIILGNNLEEAGAYPDNEPEFIARFNDLLPFAIGDGKKIEVLMPVGNLMKHEIVALGHELKAPLDLTWSCYRAGPVHCGTCGPCFMRRTAFAINNLPEVISYANG